MTKRLAFMLAVALGACAGSGSGRVEYAAGVTVRSPELVTVDEDIYVLADADEPVFYTDNYYWLYRQNRWYRSHSYDRDWIYVSAPSPRLRRINQPTAYIRYRSRTQEARNQPRPAPAPRDPWREQYDRPDAPPTLPPHQQPPLQPTQPQQPPTPYPQPPQGEPPAHDHHIDAPAPTTTNPPPSTVPGRLEPPVVKTPPGQDVRPQPPGQADRDKPATPPGQADKDKDKAKAPPARADQTTDKRGNENANDKRTKAEKAKAEKDKKDKKRDY